MKTVFSKITKGMDITTALKKPRYRVPLEYTL
jgi:hypothetical protein